MLISSSRRWIFRMTLYQSCKGIKSFSSNYKMERAEWKHSAMIKFGRASPKRIAIWGIERQFQDTNNFYAMSSSPQDIWINTSQSKFAPSFVHRCEHTTSTSRLLLSDAESKNTFSPSQRFNALQTFRKQRQTTGLRRREKSENSLFIRFLMSSCDAYSSLRT